MPQPLLSGGMPTPGCGVGVGAGVGTGVGTGVVGVAGALPLPQATCAMSAPAAQNKRMEGFNVTH